MGGQQFTSRQLTSAEICMWGRQLAVMLALYTSKGVAPEVNLREHISRTWPPPSANKAEPTLALQPRGDFTRSPKQGYQWPHKWICVQEKLKKKKDLRVCEVVLVYDVTLFFLQTISHIQSSYH